MRSHLPVLPILGFVVMGCGTSPEFREEVIVEADEVEYVPAYTTKSVLGEWKGMGQQSDGTTWDMELSITSHRVGKCARIRYPTSGCSGYWECTAPFDGAQLEAVEHITEGRDKCIDAVDVQLVVDEGGRSVSFYANAGEITAEGRLGRK